MGGNGSTARKVSFGLDENEKVTVIEGVKLSEDVLRRMRESQGSDSDKPPPSQLDSKKPPPPTGPSSTEIHEEMRKNFERQQALVQEQLARLAQRERETAVTTGLDDLTPALLIEKGKAHEEQEKVKMLSAILLPVKAWLSGHIKAFHLILTPASPCRPCCRCASHIPPDYLCQTTGDERKRAGQHFQLL
ncbi:MICOS complex subunit mic25a-like isoform X2 [Thunnus maccoyii]|uniref:MICOS complex subunit mic25a-like isoform X2 n=1 Tax=Thunnus maccoyii TaxID=8240 RepID=UPI001C4CD793|nr:MICOS complex subunit mic25a-like isoform X2 [Thunnus maccoyii]